MVERGFQSDPIKIWRSQVDKNSLGDDESEAPVTDFASSTSTTAGGPDFQYLLSMAIMSSSKEKKEELLRQRDQKVLLILSFSFGLSRNASIANVVIREIKFSRIFANFVIHKIKFSRNPFFPGPESPYVNERDLASL